MTPHSKVELNFKIEHVHDVILELCSYAIVSAGPFLPDCSFCIVIFYSVMFIAFMKYFSNYVMKAMIAHCAAAEWKQ